MYQPVKNAFQSIGARGKYQKLMIVFLFFIAAEVNYLLFGPTFVFMNPLFRCSFTDELVDESIACDRLAECTLDNDYTIVAAANLYCDGQIYRNLVQSVTFLGAIIGLLVINFVSDYKGRKFAIILAQVVAIFGISLTILGGYTASVAILAISQFFCGFSGYSMVIMAYILPSEYCDNQYRQKLIIIINYAWALTILMIGILFYVYNKWYNFLVLFVLLPMIGVLLISFFYLVEGPNFLYGSKREKQCLESMRVIAMYNNTLKQFQVVAENFKYQSAQIKQDYDKTQSLKSVLKNKKYLKMLILMIFIDAGGNLYYIGTNYALDQIGLSYGANMITGGIIEFFAFLSLQFTITRFPRRKGLLFTYSSMALLGLLFFIKPIQDSQTWSIIIISLCRYIGTISYTILIMMLTQFFPLKVQSACAGIIESIAQLGGFVGPIVITFCINLQIYPLIVLSFIIFLIIVLPLWAMGEQKETNTPDQEQKVEQLLSGSQTQSES